ncbi:MAG TPA: transglutaminase, partial [Casimicrobiaceae bacterium]
MDRRSFLASTAALPLASALPSTALAQERSFTPAPGAWRTYEVTTRIEVVNAGPGTQAWVPVPVVNTTWQKSLESRFGGNTKTAAEVVEPVYGAKMVHATWADDESAPVLEVISRIQAQDRRYDWNMAANASAPTEVLLPYLKATPLMPTDGIVLATAEKITANATTDEQKVRALFDWVVVNTYREPKVRGCGVGDIKAMLETGNMGGKCGD